MVKRFYRQLKAEIKSHQTGRWTEVFPIILLGIRAAVREDLKAFLAKLVYEETIRLPGQFIEQQANNSLATSLS